MSDSNTETMTTDAIEVHSQVHCAIEDMPKIEQSLLFAELAALSYFDPGSVEEPLLKCGFTDSQFFERDGAQAWMFGNDRDCVVACRGTEPNEWNDIKADVNAVAVFTETFGRVHRGFNEEVDDLWPRLEDALRENDRTLWFTGHSLGGAMATICAGRCFLSEIDSLPYALFTYGSPRVGDRRFVNFVELNHTRWVNNNDIVTRVPPVWMGYRHSGQEMYLDRHGKIRSISGWGRMADRTRGLLGGLLKFKVDHLADHSMERYIEYIRAALADHRAH